jgi:hypothetical protein
MRYEFIAVGVLALCVVDARAQQPQPTPAQPPAAAADGTTAPRQPWTYQDYHRERPDTMAIARARAQVRAQQRENRIATRKWFGYSNLRPVASPTPFMGTYSPMWVSNTGRPYAWSGGGGSYWW